MTPNKEVQLCYLVKYKLYLSSHELFLYFACKSIQNVFCKFVARLQLYSQNYLGLKYYFHNPLRKAVSFAIVSEVVSDTC